MNDFEQNMKDIIAFGVPCVIRDANEIPDLITTNAETRYHKELDMIAEKIKAEYQRVLGCNLRHRDFEIKIAPPLRRTWKTLMEYNFRVQYGQDTCTIQLPFDYEKYVNQTGGYTNYQLRPGDAAMIAKAIEDNFDSSPEGYRRTVSNLIEEAIQRAGSLSDMNIKWDYPIPEAVLKELNDKKYNVWIESVFPNSTHIQVTQ